LGGWGRIVGLLVAFLYFALMNSALGAGRTVGKRLMRIRVVDSNDSLITVGRSSARYLILAVPYFLNGTPIPPKILLGWIGIVFSFIVFGIGFSIVYLFVFNRRTRQSLHDLVVGTFVVKTDRSREAPKPKVWAGHYAIVALIFIASICAPLFLGGLITKSPFKDLLPLQSSLMDLPDIRYASVFAGKPLFRIRKELNGPAIFPLQSRLTSESKTMTHLRTAWRARFSTIIPKQGKRIGSF